MKEDIGFQSRGEVLSATVATPDKPIKGALLRISGGYNAGYKPAEWQDQLLGRGIASFTFDFAGVGGSSGELSSTNLETRLADARSALEYFRGRLPEGTPVHVLGVSMGAPIAIWLAGDVELAGLILAVAAAYPSGSHDKDFGEPFSTAIRGEGLWRDSVEFDMLRAINAPLMLVNALRDEVIPGAITDNYTSIVESKNGKVVDYDVHHAFMRRIEKDNDVRAQFWDDIADFILDA